MRMMGADSVAYHQATVMGRADDFPGQALAYYASRGETPLVWGGGGAARLGLNGRVTVEQYSAIYGPGGAKHPAAGAQLASTRRPGMELVISAHKSVAELGVMGKAEDTHRIMDAERDATLSYLEAVTMERGGRRGRLRLSSPTSGLVYAHTRHATSRAGDPCPHDHVLLANVVEMLDDWGGWKAADTTVWREQLHAATAVGRMAGARVAVELGAPWPIDPVDACLSLAGLVPVLSLIVDPERTKGLSAGYGIDLRDGPSLTIRFTDGVYGVESAGAAPVDVTISADPVAFLMVGTGRLSRYEAVALGLLTAGGPCPELALGFPDLFLKA